MRTLALCITILVLSNPAHANSDLREGFRLIWKGTKKTTKKVVDKTKEIGRDIGEGVQEVFDPNDEDLRASREKKKH